MDSVIQLYDSIPTSLFIKNNVKTCKLYKTYIKRGIKYLINLQFNNLNTLVNYKQFYSFHTKFPPFLLICGLVPLPLFKFVVHKFKFRGPYGTILHALVRVKVYDDDIIDRLKYVINECKINVNETNNFKQTCLFFIKNEAVFDYLMNNYHINVWHTDIWGHCAFEYSLNEDNSMLNKFINWSPLEFLQNPTKYPLYVIERLLLLKPNFVKPHLKLYLALNQVPLNKNYFQKLNINIDEDKEQFFKTCDQCLINICGSSHEYRRLFLVQILKGNSFFTLDKYNDNNDYELIVGITCYFRYLDLILDNNITTITSSETEIFKMATMRYARYTILPDVYMEKILKLKNLSFVAIFLFYAGIINKQLYLSKAILLRDSQGKTLLHHPYCVKPEWIKYYKEAGANVNVIDNSGNTPLDSYCLSNDDLIIQILKEYGGQCHNFFKKSI